jgi:hypothetical protein
MREESERENEGVRQEGQKRVNAESLYVCVCERERAKEREKEKSCGRAKEDAARRERESPARETKKTRGGGQEIEIASEKQVWQSEVCMVLCAHVHMSFFFDIPIKSRAQTHKKGGGGEKHRKTGRQPVCMCVCVCVCVFVCIYMFINIYSYIHTYIHTYIL